MHSYPDELKGRHSGSWGVAWSAHQQFKEGFAERQIGDTSINQRLRSNPAQRPEKPQNVPIG